jgi:YidC/Oxa1 family membrane protein insertase
MENPKYKGPWRVAAVVGAAVVLATLPARQAAAEPVTFEAGLPPSLAIGAKTAAGGALDQPWLHDQLRVLEGLMAWAQQSAPQQQPWWQKLFTGSPSKVRRVPFEQLATAASALRGQQIEVTGVWLESTAASGELRTPQVTCLVELAEGTVPEGFGDRHVTGLPVSVEGTVELRGSQPVIRATRVTPGVGLATLRAARVQELLGQNDAAIAGYVKAEAALRTTDLGLAAFARVSAGRIAYDQLRSKPLAGKHYNMAWTTYVTNITPGTPAVRVWMPDTGKRAWTASPVREAIGDTLDRLNGESFWYRFVAFFVALCGGSAALGVLLISAIVRMVIWPLTKKQLQSAEAMKKLQPQIKELQARLADDKQRFQQEFWLLCKANGVNPLGGCLPLLIQMPVLIMVYKGIRLYVVQFDRSSFLWVQNLGGPDMILLVAYTLSMILFQKMTQRTNPQAVVDPQQEQQQKMMMYMMPLMFFFMFKTFPAAFILYWLGTNIIYFLQQWNYTRRLEAADGVRASSESDAGGTLGALRRSAGSLKRALSGEPAEERDRNAAPRTVQGGSAGRPTPPATAARPKRKGGKRK